MARDVARYYDELHRWTAKDTDFQVFSGLENDTIHRFLVDADTGAFSPDTVYKFIDPHIAAQSSPQTIALQFVQGWRCLQRGEAPHNRVDRERGY